MTIERADSKPPPRADRTPAERAERHPRTPVPKPDHQSPHDERHWLADLAACTLGTWGNTTRLITLMVVLTVLIVGGLTWLQVDLDLGPVHVSRR